ncbi:beta-mannanase [Paenarthrobacter sp. DKR-5]|uniref:glycoside hydrolase family 26 protein n=1 Tax=Paenarthrobacter sp. DKR-5 TaxID=2835535 RepID=UPI001BDD4944|nr:glycosyl hydrolase [Paenarthrobacter sp. DKR-5]MBT1004433.1 beta-mannanase [Paenarthrobacter sp. DKR-5]
MKRRTVLGLLLGLAAAGLSLPAPAAAAPLLSLSPSSGPSGTVVAVRGSGFPKKAAGTVTAGTVTVPFRTGANGAFSVSVTVAGPAGKLAVTAAAGTARSSSSFTVTSSVPGISAAALRFGVANPGGPAATQELDGIAVLAGEAPSIIMDYKDFSQAPPISDLDAVRARGAVTMLTWEPWIAGQGVDQPAFALGRIAAGAYDGYLHQWGSALASWGHPVYLRFGHEMNGNWYPWSEQVNGNQPGDYARAWRHVHDVLAADGAANVNWVWSPNVPYPGSTPLNGLYPGPDVVDTVALDGYNWGTSQSWSAWLNPSDLFGAGLADLRAAAPGKPVLVGETASAEAGGSKPQWISDAVAYLAAQPDITGFLWFDYNKETDWRIDSTSASADAFAAALRARR